MVKPTISFLKRLGTDGKNLLLRLPDDVKDSLNLRPGDYCEFRLRLVKSREEELRESGASEQQIQQLLLPKTKTLA